MFKILLSLAISFSSFSFASAVNFNGNIYKELYKYKRLHKKFTANVCQKGEDFRYLKKLKDYRGEGNYLPLVNGKVDYITIKKNIKNLKKKAFYTKQIYGRLKKQKNIPSFNTLSSDLRDSIDQILLLKKIIFLNDKSSGESKTQLSKSIKVLKNNFDQFVSKIYFLKSFNYPNDHLGNRSGYEKSKGKGSKHKSNRRYFYRKIVEDGAFDQDNTRPDIYLRSTIDTLKLKIDKLKDDLDENTRYDLEWMLTNVKYQLKRGYKKQLERINNWKLISSKSLAFYKDVIALKNAKTIKKRLEDKDIATKALTEFVYKKQAETYKWWMKQSELMRAIYVMETILFNEVGSVDSDAGLERSDVIQIVLNRLKDSTYSRLYTTQDLYKELKLKKSEINKYKWLNTLFRKAEFSFTFHYISSVSKIFCPDMSRAGKKLRDENIKISLKALKKKRYEFKPVRYFSRISMLGKIDMAQVWTNFTPLAERAGYEVSNQQSLQKAYKDGQFDYYYSFKDPDSKEFDVVRINKNTYSVFQSKKKPIFHEYRDPNLFKYFY